MERSRRREEIEDVYRAARDPARRAEVLAAAGPEVRAEVEALLRQDETAAPGEVSAAGLGWSVLGPYRLLHVLGSGGMGEVYRAIDTRLDRPVAIKLLHGPHAGDASARERFRREALAISRLNHPGICTVHDVGEQDGTPYLVMECLEGETLQRRLERGALPLDALITIAIQVADSLAAAHAKGIVHRDVKPSNVFLTEGGQAKVMDFGLAKLNAPGGAAEERAATLTATGAAMGTMAYMSPEQARGEEVDARTDLFSLGATLYEMATGVRPFRGATTALAFEALLGREPPPPPRALRPDLPPELESIILRAVEKDRERRTPSSADVLTALRELPGMTAGEGGWPRGRRARAHSAGNGMARFHRAWLVPIAVVAVAGIAVTAAVLANRQGRPEEAPVVAPAPPPPPVAPSPEAQELYLRGLSHLARSSEEDVDQAIGLLERSDALAPGSPPTLAGLAYAYGTKAFQFAKDDPQWEEKTFAVARKLLALDPDSPEGHFAMGVYLWRPSQGFAAREALAELRKALKGRPDLDQAWHQHALILFHVGHLDASRRDIERALQLNPSNTLARSRLGPLNVYQGRYPEAIAALRSVPPKVYLALWYQQLAWSFMALDRLGDAQREIEAGMKADPRDPGGRLHAARAMLRALRGDPRGAAADVAVAVGDGKRNGEFHHTAYCVAAVYARLGELEKAQQWIEEAARTGFPNWAYFENDVFLRPLHGRPAFQAFIASLRSEWEHLSDED